MQISARIPFKADIAFVSGTGVKTSRVEERLSSLTGFFTVLCFQVFPEFKEVFHVGFHEQKFFFHVLFHIGFLPFRYLANQSTKREAKWIWCQIWELLQNGCQGNVNITEYICDYLKIEHYEMSLSPVFYGINLGDVEMGGVMCWWFEENPSLSFSFDKHWKTFASVGISNHSNDNEKVICFLLEISLWFNWIFVILNTEDAKMTTFCFSLILNQWLSGRLLLGTC